MENSVEAFSSKIYSELTIHFDIKLSLLFLSPELSELLLFVGTLYGQFPIVELVLGSE